MALAERRDFYTGRMNETDVFGRFRPSKDFEDAYRAIAKENGFVAYKTALDLVRKHTDQDPVNPIQPFAKELRIAVIDALSLETEEQMDRLKFYTAVGTAADIFHGIDGWFEYTDDDGNKIIVTLDVTTNPKKETWKADVIIQEVADPSEDENRFIADAERYAKEIVKQFEVKMSAIDVKTA
ncbi:hypothetical protein HY771_03755 [Candidatus Uhrbacteria bacterium]|nr:hypothetical protein [Candidatus Uhrbacteria bacterium]